MSDLDLKHPLAKAFRAWKQWEAILVSGRTPSRPIDGNAGSPATASSSTIELPAPASLAELQFWGEMRNAHQARYEDDLSTYLAAHPGMTRESVERELASLFQISADGLHRRG